MKLVTPSRARTSRVCTLAKARQRLERVGISPHILGIHRLRLDLQAEQAASDEPLKHHRFGPCRVDHGHHFKGHQAFLAQLGNAVGQHLGRVNLRHHRLLRRDLRLTPAGE